MITKLNLDVPDYAIVTTEEELLKAVETIGYPCVVKLAEADMTVKGKF